MRTTVGICGFVVASLAAPALYAQTTNEAEPLPPPQSSNDAYPPVAKPATAGGELAVTKQAGVGGSQAYGRRGVLELGGFAGYRGAANYKQFNFDPTVGYFVADNLELSLILGLDYLKVPDVDGSTLFRGLIEPSYHLPLSETLFAFLGVGFGVAYNAGDTGFAISPRLGLNALVGRSGILSPAFSVDYSTASISGGAGGSGTTVVGVKTSYGFSLGYTVMW